MLIFVDDGFHRKFHTKRIPLLSDLEAECLQSESLDTPVVPPVLPASFLHGASVGSHGYKLLHEQLILQTHQTQILRAEVQLLRENLASETALRQDLQVR